MTKTPDPKLSEAGRKGGIASGEARRKRKQRGFIGAAKALVTSDPERVVEQLASSPAGVVKLVSVLERHGVFEPPVEAEEPATAPGDPVGIADIIRLYVESRQEHLLLGVSLSDEQRAQVLGPAGVELEESVGLRARDVAAISERAAAPTDDDDERGLDAMGGGAEPERSRNPAPPGSENLDP